MKEGQGTGWFAVVRYWGNYRRLAHFKQWGGGARTGTATQLLVSADLGVATLSNGVVTARSLVCLHLERTLLMACDAMMALATSIRGRECRRLDSREKGGDASMR